MAAFHARLVALAVPLALLAGCSPSPVDSSSPLGAQPSFSCIPETGGAPQACYEYEHQQSITRDKLYAEAEVVLRKILAEDERIYRMGGITEATPLMQATITAEALKDALIEFRAFHSEQTKAVGGHYRLGYVKRVPGLVREGSVVALEACIDASTVDMKEPGSTTKGTITAQRFYFSDDGSALKASYTEWKEVESC